MKKTTFTFGADPELFLFDKEQKKVVSSIPVLKRNKENPIEIAKGVKIYADNALVELAFPPAENKHQFIETLRTAFARTKEYFGNRYSLLPQAAYEYERNQLKDKLHYVKDGKEETMTAWDIGCNPSFDVYRRCENKIRKFENGFRSGSFHIHIGNKYYKTDANGKLLTNESRSAAVKLMDIFVGVPSILFDKDKTAPIRRKLYGRAGECRKTPYGIEYRVLGNFALRSPELVSLVFDLTQYALSYINDGREKEILNRINPNTIMKAINANDKILAKQILKLAKLPPQFMKRIKNNWNPDFNKAWGI